MKYLLLKKIMFFFLCHFVNSYIYSAELPSLISLPQEITISIVMTKEELDLVTICLMKQTCKKLNGFFENHEFIKQISPMTCEKALDDCWSVKNQHNFKVFLKNNEENRKKEIIQFLNTAEKFDFSGSLNEKENIQKSIPEIWTNIQLKAGKMRWSALVPVPRVLQIIATSDQPNVSDALGRTLFIWLCGEYLIEQKKLDENQRLYMLKIILENQKTNVNQSDNNGYTGFMVACLFGNPDVIQILLNQKHHSLDLDFDIHSRRLFDLMTDKKNVATKNCITPEKLELLLSDDRINVPCEKLFKKWYLKEVLEDFFKEKVQQEPKKYHKFLQAYKYYIDSDTDSLLSKIREYKTALCQNQG